MVFNKIKISLFLFVLVFISCREEIIPPGNVAGNINEPSLTRTSNSYIFSINASKITTSITDNTFLNTFKARIYSVIADYSSGYVEIEVKTDRNNILYSEVFEDDTRGTLKNIEGSRPDIIVVNFQNFTGRLNVTLSRAE
jgi:hypothetical protein